MLHGAQGGDILRRVVVRASRSVLPTQPLLRQFSGTSALKRNRDSSLTTQLAEHGLGDDAGTRKPVLSEQQPRRLPRLPRSIKALNSLLARISLREIDDSELEEQFVRGGGPGGQAINKTNSSVSLKHLPTGLRVQAQPTRSRENNRRAARKILAEKLADMQAEANQQAFLSEQGNIQVDDELLLRLYTAKNMRAAKDGSRSGNLAKKQRKKAEKEMKDANNYSVSMGSDDDPP